MPDAAARNGSPTINHEDPDPACGPLRVATAASEEIDIVDTDDGHLVSRLKATPPDVPNGAQ